MTNEEIIKKLKADFNFDAPDGLKKVDLNALLSGFEAKAELANVEKTNKQLNGVVEDMQKRVKEAEALTAKAAPNLHTVKVAGVNYQVTSGTILPTVGKLSAKEISKDRDVAKEILKLEGQTILKKL